MTKAVRMLKDSIALMKIRYSYALQINNHADAEFYSEQINKLESKLKYVLAIKGDSNESKGKENTEFEG